MEAAAEHIYQGALKAACAGADPGAYGEGGGEEEEGDKKLVRPALPSHTGHPGYASTPGPAEGRGAQQAAGQYSGTLHSPAAPSPPSSPPPHVAATGTSRGPREQGAPAPMPTRQVLRSRGFTRPHSLLVREACGPPNRHRPPLTLHLQSHLRHALPLQRLPRPSRPSRLVKLQPASLPTPFPLNPLMGRRN